VRIGLLGRVLALVAIGVLVFVAAPRDARAATDLVPGGGAVVATDALNLRGGPGTVNPVVAVLAGGTSLRLIAGPVDDVWWRVTDGQNVGYVNGDWLQSAAAPSGTDAYDIDLSVPIHRQLTRVWCDPADLQSWVEFDQGQTLGDSYPAQQHFWDWELGHNAGFTVDQWDASPFAVASAAHQWLPTRGFNHFIYDDPVQATATAAWVLANPAYHEPAVANIWWGDHYVLVRGVRATADPFASYPNAKILGVYIMDPNQGRPSWLGQDRYIPIDAWVSRYLTPVSYLTPHSGTPDDVWQGKYVMIQRDWSNAGPSLPGRLNATPAQYLAASG
jgi:hypothetical protein